MGDEIHFGEHGGKAPFVIAHNRIVQIDQIDAVFFQEAGDLNGGDNHPLDDVHRPLHHLEPKQQHPSQRGFKKFGKEFFEDKRLGRFMTWVSIPWERSWSTSRLST